MLLSWNEDRRLVKKALAGDREAAERLVAQHYPSVNWFLLHLTRNADQAAELAQETFLKAWQRLGTYEGRASFRTWLHRIAYREYAVRRNLPDFAELPEEADDQRQNFLGPLVNVMAMERAIAALPERLRITFVICQVEEMSAREAAEILSVPVGTVLSRLYTAREQLRRQLAMREIVSSIPATEHDYRPTEGLPKKNEMSKAVR